MLKAVNLRTEYKKSPLGMDEPRPRFSYELTGNGCSQTERKISVRKEDGSVVWDTGWVKDPETIQIVYAGSVLEPFTRYLWTVTVKDEKGKTGPASEEAFFETGFMTVPWSAFWIGGKPGMYFRDIVLAKKPAKARLYATALGVYRASLNGKEASEDQMAPGWTDYFTRVQYQAYDVTALLKKGGNTLAFELGKGWYAGRISNLWNNSKTTYGDDPAFLCELHLEYADGTTDVIVSDRDFKKLAPIETTSTDIRFSDIYDGEVIRSGLALENWKLYQERPYGYCIPATVVQKQVQVVWQSGAPIRTILTVSPIRITRTGPGRLLVDFGQNCAGREHILLHNTVRGMTLHLKHGEMLNGDGSLYVDNLRTAEAVTVYTCSGGETEVIEPKHTFYGFRYLEICGWYDETDPVDLNDFYINVLCSDLEKTGMFSCSDPLLNRLYSNIVWGQRSNFLDVPTDCPQRDERLGWTGDTQVFANMATWNMFAPEFYTKWIIDLNLCRSAAGSYPCYSPDPYRMARDLEGGGGTGWGDAGIIVPWIMYVKYGDTRLLKTYLKNMCRWLDVQVELAGGFITKNSRYLDWLNLDAPTSAEFLSTAYVGGMAHLMEKIALLCGDKQEAARRKELFENVKAAFGKAFFTPAGDLKEKTQTAALLALHFDLVPEKARKKTAAFLVKDIQVTHKTHLTTGFLGTPLLLKVLTDIGETDLAYDLLLQTTYPGWLYPVVQGATTMWERWNSWTRDKGFGSVSMNSFNHYAYGAVGEWFFETICGIRPDPENPAFRHFTLAPVPGKRLTEACASYRSIRGTILSEWRKEKDGRFHWRFQVPAGTTAEVVFPVSGIPKVDGITKGKDGRWTAQPGKYELFLGVKPEGSRKIQD